MIRTRRIYDPGQEDDGERILVDRLWPRGISKEAAQLDEWAKEIAPSDELRKWYGHDSEKWGAFKQRYRAELQQKEKSETLRELADKSRRGTITLLYAARDESHNNAAALAEFIEKLNQ